MPRLVIVLLALTLSGCANIVMRPAVDDVRTGGRDLRDRSRDPVAA